MDGGPASPRYDLAEADANRFYPFMTSPPTCASAARSSTARSTTSSIRSSSRRSPANLRLTPFYRPAPGARRRVLHGRGVGAPAVVRANRDRVGGVRHEWARRTGWAARGWSPTWAPSTSPRARTPRSSTSRRSRSSTSRGPTRSRYLERVFANRIDRPVGSIVYTAALTPRGGIRLDLTVIRKDEELFRVITGGGSGPHDLAWLRPADRRGRARPHHASARVRSSRWVCGVPRRATSCRR